MNPAIGLLARRSANSGESHGKHANVSAMNRRDLQRRFDHAAGTFDSADFVHAKTRDGLLARLQPMTLQPSTILDIGAATGASGRLLAKRFRRARVVAVDLSHAMLKKAAAGSGWFSRAAAVQAAAEQLPFADESVDLVFANLLLPWTDDRAAVFREVARVLCNDGLFLFSTLGPDSLAGLSTKQFDDMHDIGDEIVRAGLRDPVLDVDRLTVTYESRASLLSDVEALGMAGCVSADTPFSPVQLELVYGHAWGPGERSSRGVVKVDAGHIGLRKR